MLAGMFIFVMPGSQTPGVWWLHVSVSVSVLELTVSAQDGGGELLQSVEFSTCLAITRYQTQQYSTLSHLSSHTYTLARGPAPGGRREGRRGGRRTGAGMLC